ncbi:lipopolysaccharide assembly protein LapA domain-containing protein [Yinghuangia sp. YIM S09857]|uniref:lipopolysaccharide assembly protein LapA domain-containing protein n=1 Tax=Yinghuangia sp. YIM S09857 TaxID=3436929 RepID=UPI003F52BB6B
MAKNNAKVAGGQDRGVTTRQITSVVIVVLSIWFIAVNTESTKIRFWVPEVEAPLWLVLAGAFVLGGITMWLIGRNRRSR